MGIQVILIHEMTFQSSLYRYSCLTKSQQSLDGDFLIIEIFLKPWLSVWPSPTSHHYFPPATRICKIGERPRSNPETGFQWAQEPHSIVFFQYCYYNTSSWNCAHTKCWYKMLSQENLSWLAIFFTFVSISTNMISTKIYIKEQLKYTTHVYLNASSITFYLFTM